MDWGKNLDERPNDTVNKQLGLKGVENFLTDYLPASDRLVTGLPLDTSTDIIYVLGKVALGSGWGARVCECLVTHNLNFGERALHFHSYLVCHI